MIFCRGLDVKNRMARKHIQVPLYSLQRATIHVRTSATGLNNDHYCVATSAHNLRHAEPES